jgi:hypothetical protein
MEMTNISEEQFILTLPGSWYVVSKNYPDFYQYRSSDELENLSISIYLSENSVDANEIPAMLDDFLKIRLQKEREASESSNLTISDVIQEKQGDAMIGFYYGFHPEIDRRFAVFVIADKQRIALFYYEALDMHEDQFQLKLEQVIGRVNLREHTPR